MIPNPGKMRMYTSGCPKNQNKCWYKIGSPPPSGSKKEVLMFRSVRSIVIAPAKTGREKRSKNEVTIIDQTNKGIRSMIIPEKRITKIVVIKLIDLKIEETPPKCKEKMAKSTDTSLWKEILERGGYTVHPVPAPRETMEERIKKDIAGRSIQNLKLFIRGKCMSWQPNIKGRSQLPNPPIKTGITTKKIMMKAWDVTKTL